MRHKRALQAPGALPRRSRGGSAVMTKPAAGVQPARGGSRTAVAIAVRRRQHLPLLVPIAGHRRRSSLVAGSCRCVLRADRVATRGGILPGLRRRRHAVSAAPGRRPGCACTAPPLRGTSTRTWRAPNSRKCTRVGAGCRRWRAAPASPPCTALTARLLGRRATPAHCSYVVFTEIFMKKSNGESSGVFEEMFWACAAAARAAPPCASWGACQTAAAPPEMPRLAA